MYIYTYICMYIYICIHTYVCIYIYTYIHSWGVIYLFLPTIPWDAQVVHQFPRPSHRLRKLKSWVEVSRPPATRRFGRDMALSLGIKPGPTDTAWGTGVTPKHPWFASGYIRILRSNMLKSSFFLEHKLTYFVIGDSDPAEKQNDSHLCMEHLKVMVYLDAYQRLFRVCRGY